MSKLELIQALRAQIGIVTASGKEFWRAPNLNGGIAKGIVAELLGNARTEWLVQVFVQNPEHYIYWCERDEHVLPTRLAEQGLDLTRVRFVYGSDDLQRILRLAVETPHYPFVVAPNRLKEVTAFQRLHLLAEKSKSTVFLMADKKFSQAWPIALQLEIKSSGGDFEIDIQRQRHVGAK
jgi:hypothetical protein